MNINCFLKNHPTITHQLDIREICKPLKKLGIFYFSHAHINENSKMSAIASCPYFFELYFKNKFHQHDVHMVDNLKSESYIIWDSFKRTKESEKMHPLFTSFDRDHTFSIIRTNNRKKDCYHFAVKKGEFFMNNRYLQLLDELNNFINYFTAQVNSIKYLKQSYNLEVQLNTKYGGYTTEKSIIFDSFDKQNYPKNINKFYINHIDYITKKELECLHWIYQGKTFIEISIILNITERTVKEHFKNIKDKLQCKTLFQLGSYYEKLISRGINNWS